MTQPTVSPARIILQYLLDNGTVNSYNSSEWPAIVGALRDGTSVPDDMIGFINTPGRRQGRVYPTKEVIRSFGVQVRVRGLDHDEAYTKASAILNKLDAATRVTVTVEGSDFLLTSVQAQGIMYAGKDQETRSRENFTINSQVKIKQL